MVFDLRVVPRLTTTNILSMNSPAEGLLVYDKVEKRFKYFVENQWVTLNPIPKGTIIMWNGTIPPKGWKLCDGGGSPSRPDLRGRFVVGYREGNDDYGIILSTGGEKVHILTEDEMPNHNHGFNDAGHSHSGMVNTSNHDHPFLYDDISISANSTTDGEGFDDVAASVDANESGTTTNDPYMVSLSLNSARLSLEDTGDDQDHENLPPYYVVAFIIKE